MYEARIYRKNRSILNSASGTLSSQQLTGLFYVPSNHVCMDYEPFKVSYVAGQPFVGATLPMFPGPDKPERMGTFLAWDAGKDKIVWSKPEQFSVWSGAPTTAGGVAFYGTLEDYFKAVDQKTGKGLYKFKTRSGVIGNVFTYMQGGKQYVGVLSGMAAGPALVWRLA